MGDESGKINPNSVMANFIEQQTQTNMLNSKFIEDTRKSQESTAEINCRDIEKAYGSLPSTTSQEEEEG